jgi:hypothetical protein
LSRVIILENKISAKDIGNYYLSTENWIYRCYSYSFNQKDLSINVSSDNVSFFHHQNLKDYYNPETNGVNFFFNVDPTKYKINSIQFFVNINPNISNVILRYSMFKQKESETILIYPNFIADKDKLSYFSI